MKYIKNLPSKAFLQHFLIKICQLAILAHSLLFLLHQQPSLNYKTTLI
jgi:hypothetical protein